MRHEHVGIAVTNGARAGCENVAARRIGENEWQLINSPLYATEVAAGDVVRILNNETGAFQVVTRGGNVCVQFYLGTTEADDAKKTREAAEAIALKIRPLGGRMDGHTPGLISFTVPVDVGFPAIEKVFAAAVARYAGSQWQFSNVYDPITGDPLGWWK